MILLNLDDINQEWAKDVDIYEASVDLIGENKKIPKLHHKYYMSYNHHTIELIDLRNKAKTLNRMKYEYYSGTMPTTELKSLNWPINNLKILKVDIPRYIETDKDIIKLNSMIANKEVIIKYLEDIIKKVNNRTFEIKNHIDLLKLQAGIV